MLIPFATRPAHPMYWRFTPAVASPAFSWPVSSIAPITSPPRRPSRRAASARPAAANRRTSLIAASASHDARFSSRCIRSGVRSPACSAIVHPFRFGISLTSADTYLPACCHVSVRPKHGLKMRQYTDARAEWLTVVHLPGYTPRPQRCRRHLAKHEKQPRQPRHHHPRRARGHGPQPTPQDPAPARPHQRLPSARPASPSKPSRPSLVNRPWPFGLCK